MIHQYLFGRKSQGYQQLNDLSRSGYSTKDIKNFESINEYSVLAELNPHDLPECVYYYNEDTALGHMGVWGKTVHVPAGKSEESGSRVTTFVHKYLLSDDEIKKDYTNFLTNPRELLRIRQFCEQVEDTYDYDMDCVHFEETMEIPEWEEVLNKLKLPRTEQFLKKLLWNLIDCAGSTGKKTYIVYPENTKEMSVYAQYFWIYLYEALPPFIRGNSGFLSYAYTFSDAQRSHIPSGATLVFVANTEENRSKYMSVRHHHYLYDFSCGLEAEIPGILTAESQNEIESILETLKNAIIDNKNSKYSAWWSVIDDKYPPFTRFTMEEFANIIEFYHYFSRMEQEKNDKDIPSAFNMRRMLHYMLGENECRSEIVKKDAETYITFFYRTVYLDKAHVTRDDIDMDMLDLLGDWCLLFPDSSQVAVSLFMDLLKLCENDMGVFCDLLDYNFSSPILNEQIKKQLYDNPAFENVACIRYKHMIETKVREEGEKEDDKADCLLKMVNVMKKESSTFISSQGAIDIFGQYFQEFVIEKKEKNSLDYLERVRIYWKKLTQLSSEKALSAYGNLLNPCISDVANAMLSGKELDDIDDSVLSEFVSWGKDMGKNPSLESLKPLWEKVNWEERSRQYCKMFKKNPAELYDFLKQQPEKEKDLMLREPHFIDAAADYIKKNSDWYIIANYQDAYCMLMVDFYIRYEGHRKLILESLSHVKENKIFILAQFYAEASQYFSSEKINKNEIKTAIADDIKKMYQKGELKIIDLRQNNEFAEELDLTYILEENSMKGKFKSLGNKSAEWVKSRLEEHKNQSEAEHEDITEKQSETEYEDGTKSRSNLPERDFEDENLPKENKNLMQDDPIASYRKNEREMWTSSSQETVGSEPQKQNYGYYNVQTDTYSNSEYRKTKAIQENEQKKSVSKSGRIEIADSNGFRIHKEYVQGESLETEGSKKEEKNSTGEVVTLNKDAGKAKPKKNRIWGWFKK